MCGNISKPRFCAWCGYVPRIFWWGNLFGEIKGEEGKYYTRQIEY